MHACVLSHFRRVQLCDAMDCGPPGSSVHGILQARILEWAAIPSSRRSSQPRDRTQVSTLQADSLPSEPLGVKKKKKKKKKSGLYEAVRARSMKNTWISFKAHASLGSTAGPWRSRTWLRRKALESDQCGLESQLRVIPENENDPNK